MLSVKKYSNDYISKVFVCFMFLHYAVMFEHHLERQSAILTAIIRLEKKKKLYFDMVDFFRMDDRVAAENLLQRHITYCNITC